MKTILKQKGIALLLFATVLATAAAAVTIKALNSTGTNSHIVRDRITAAALAQAKDALIGYAVSQTRLTDTGYLPLPDLGWTATPEGNAEGTYGSRDFSLIGKLPWKTLDIAPLRSGDNECLWYVVSGRFKNSASTLTQILNWDTPGQIDVVDANGNFIASNVAALIIAPGSLLDSQNRTLANASLIQCGGNYDARNYLDPYHSTDAIAGVVNYFVNYASYTNNMIAPDTGNKRFVMANNAHYNDRLLFVTVDDIFHPIIQRKDFSIQISALLSDATFIASLQLLVINGSKGTNNVDCDNTSNSDNQNFCKSWKEMLLLTNLPSSATIIIDGVTIPDCSRVLIFGGQKTAAQVRLTNSDKAEPANYLEGGNLSSFDTPTSAHNNFNGFSIFDPKNPDHDLLRCIP